MGRDKSQLILGGETLVARAVRTLGALTDDLILVTNTPESFSGPGRALDRRRDPRRRGAVRHSRRVDGGASRVGARRGVRYAVPQPGALAVHGGSRAGARRPVVPRWQGEFEPLHTILFAPVPPRHRADPPAWRRAHRRVLRSASDVRYVEPEEIARFDPEGLSFFNVNSPEDWERAQELAARRGSDICLIRRVIMFPPCDRQFASSNARRLIGEANMKRQSMVVFGGDCSFALRVWPVLARRRGQSARGDLRPSRPLPPKSSGASRHARAEGDCGQAGSPTSRPAAATTAVIAPEPPGGPGQAQELSHQVAG